MFQEVDPVLGPEMHSTGEVLGLSKYCSEAFYKAEEAAKSTLPLKGTVIISVNDKDKPEALKLAEDLETEGFKILASDHTCKYLNRSGIHAQRINKLQEGSPNMYDAITNNEVDLVINTPVGRECRMDDSYLRKAAVKKAIPYMTTIAAAKATLKGIHSVKQFGNTEVRSLQELHADILAI